MQRLAKQCVWFGLDSEDITISGSLLLCTQGHVNIVMSVRLTARLEMLVSVPLIFSF